MKYLEYIIRSIKYFQEDFGFVDLVVFFIEYYRVDFVGGGFVVFFVGWFNVRGEDFVAIYKVFEYVSDRIFSFTDSDGFYYF